MTAMPYDPSDPWRDTPPGNVSNPSNVSHVSNFPDGSDGSDALDAFPGRGTGGELAEILNDLSEWFRHYLYTRSPHAYTVLALWVVHTHSMDGSATTPRLAVTSPVPGCGKTTVLDHLARLTMNGELGSNMTPALLARLVHAQRTTVLLDETDNLLNAKKEGVGDLVAVLNSGYRRGSSRPVLVSTKSNGWEVRRMNTYAAVALAGIGDHLPDALLSRCIPIELDKALPGHVADSDWDLIEPDALTLRDRVAQWAEAHAAEVTPANYPVNVEGLHGRTREIWMPLIVLATAAGPEWRERTLNAWEWFVNDRAESESLKPKTQKEQLLIDLAEIWREEGCPTGFVHTSELIRGLEALTPDVWGIEARYGSIKPKRLANLLNDYGVRPMHSPDKSRRGYFWQDIRDGWDRYSIPLPGHVSNVSNVSEPSATTTEPPAFPHSADTLDALDGWDALPEGVGDPGYLPDPEDPDTYGDHS